MYIKTVVLLLCLILIVLLLNDTFKQQHWQQQSDELSQTVQALQQQVKQLEVRLEQRSDRMLAAAQQQVQTAAQQSEAIDQQINSLDAVVEDLTMQQMQQKQIQAAQESLRQEALYAANRVGGLSIASGMKMAVVEHYQTMGRYPSSNVQLGYPEPASYADDNIQSITISSGGRITVVYTASSGVDGGAISLTPKDQHGMVKWRCSTADFETISQSIPDCELTQESVKDI